MSEPEREHKDQLWSEATFWFARMRSPDAEKSRAEFEAWLARGALHRRYYNRASEHWLQSTEAFAEERARIDAERNNAPQPSSGPWRKRSTAAGLVAASLVIAASTVLLVQHHRPSGSAGDTAQVSNTPPAILQFATHAGEQRRVRLADGSTIVLGGGTTIAVRLGTRLRRLDLKRGSARFAVAHEPRPFTVFAGGGAVTAHGTIFDVAIAPGNRVSVRLIRGSIDVRYPVARNSAHPRVRRLQPGESVSFAGARELQGSPAPVAAPAAEPATAALAVPLSASRDYRDVRLAEVVAAANRDAAPPIRLADPATGDRRVSGRFRTDDNMQLAKRIAALFDLTVDRSSPSAIVLRPR